MRYGVDAPRLTFKIGGTQYDLEFSDTNVVYEYTWNLEDSIEHKSVITGRKHKIVKGMYHEFNLDIIDISTISGANLNAYNALHANYKVATDVTIYPHKDNINWYRVYFTKFKPYYREGLVYCDSCLVTLESDRYQNM